MFKPQISPAPSVHPSIQRTSPASSQNKCGSQGHKCSIIHRWATSSPLTLLLLSLISSASLFFLLSYSPLLFLPFFPSLSPMSLSLLALTWFFLMTFQTVTWPVWGHWPAVVVWLTTFSSLLTVAPPDWPVGEVGQDFRWWCSPPQSHDFCFCQHV